MAEIPARLFGIVARAAPLVVIMRRGPTRWVRLLLWHTDTDVVESGQWFHGRIFERRCDLSPDGQLFVYFASKLSVGGNQEHPTVGYSWTAVSRPPYFIALKLWPKGDSWNGGGLFESNSTLLLNHHTASAEKKKRIARLNTISEPAPWYHFMTEDGPIYHARLQRDGWQLTQQAHWDRPHSLLEIQGTYIFDPPGIWEKPRPDSPMLLRMTEFGLDYRHMGEKHVLDFSLISPDQPEILIQGAEWADWDQRGRLVYAKDGQLFADDLSQPSLTPRLIADLNDMRPEPLVPPAWAKQWPSSL